MDEPFKAQELTEEMVENRQLYDAYGVLQTYDTDEEYTAALARRAGELRAQEQKLNDSMANMLDDVKGMEDMVAQFAAKNGLKYDRQVEGCEAAGATGSPEDRAKDSIRRFLQTLSPTFPSISDCALIPKRGEIVHLEFRTAALYESVSSSNTNLKLIGVGSLYVTNRRFAFVFDSQVRSLPYREIEVFSSDWIPESGRIRISSSSRARMMEFDIPNVFKASFFFAYYTNPLLAAKVRAAGDLGTDTAQRKQLIEEFYDKAKEGLKRKANEPQAVVTSAAQGASGGLAPGCIVAIIVFALILCAILYVVISAAIG